MTRDGHSDPMATVDRLLAVASAHQTTSDSHVTTDMPRAFATAAADVGRVASAPGRPDGLSHAARVAVAVLEGRGDAALALLSPLLDEPLRTSMWGARLEAIGAELATAVGDDSLAARFRARREAYLRGYGAGHAVDALAVLASEPEWLDELEAVLAIEHDAGWTHEQDGLARVPPLAAPSVVGGFVPLAGEPDVHGRDDAMAYLVTLHHLEDARTADFSSHRIGWHELDSELDGISDLVLSFEPEAESLLRQVDPDSLSLRLFFGEATGYEEVSTRVGTLYDVEVNPAESRIYLKLRRPPAWSATGLSPADLWRRLSSCVLITEVE